MNKPNYEVLYHRSEGRLDAVCDMLTSSVKIMLNNITMMEETIDANVLANESSMQMMKNSTDLNTYVDAHEKVLESNVKTSQAGLKMMKDTALELAIIANAIKEQQAADRTKFLTQSE